MSQAKSLLNNLNQHGVTVWQENGRLRYKAPAGVMTPDLITTIREHKPALLSLLAVNSIGVNNGDFTGRVNTPLVLTFELDGSRVTCIDPISETLEEAIRSVRQRFYGRVRRIWHKDLEVGADGS